MFIKWLECERVGCVDIMCHLQQNKGIVVLHHIPMALHFLEPQRSLHEEIHWGPHKFLHVHKTSHNH